MIAQISDLNLLFQNFLKVAISLVGLAMLTMILVGGFKYLSAGNDKDATQKAQKTLTFAIGGFILSVSAWIILNFIGRFLGIDFSFFSICLPGQQC